MSSPRSAMIAKIHVGKRQLALTEESYRDVLRRVTQLDTTSRMTEGQLERVLKEFERLGFKPTTKRTGTSKQAQIRMIHAVWKDIVELGGVGAEDPAAALRAFVVRQTKMKANPAGVSDAKWLDSTSANKVLEGLKGWRAWLRRAAAEAA